VRTFRKQPTGRFLLRIPTDLHDRLRRDAARRDLSLNALCTEILQGATRTGAAGGTSRGADPSWVQTARAVFGDELKGIVLFGSLARGEERQDSDVDLLIVLEDRVPITRSLYGRWDSAEPGDSAVNPRLVHLPEHNSMPGSLWVEVAMDGVIVLDPVGEISRALSRIRRAAAGTLEPRVAHDQRYWVHRRESRDYVARAGARLKALQVLLAERSWADVVRESQEVVELCLKALVRAADIEVPRVHDVSPVLEQNSDRFPAAVRPKLGELIRISRQLRRDRELAFYGSEDLTPSEFYTEDDAKVALDQARFVERTVAQALGSGAPG